MGRGRAVSSRSHLGFILNATYVADPDGGRAVVHLYGRLADGRAFLVRDRRPEPYFYIESSAADQARGLGVHDFDATDRRTLHGAPVHRVRLHHPGDTPAVRTRLHRAGIATYEADVRFAYRYLIDRGIKSALRIHGAAHPHDDTVPGAPWATVVFDEPEVEPARWVPELTALSLDIETDPKGQRLLSVALWGCGAQEVLLLCPDAAARAACPAAAIPCASEAELLTTLCGRVRALDPDVVTGWNIIDFDVPVLIRRAAELQVPLELGRAPGEVRQRGESPGRGNGGAGNGSRRRRFSDSIFIPGRVVLDGIRLLRAVSYRLDSYSLDNAAREILGEGKTLGGTDHVAQIMHTFRHEPERFVEYNLTDARLVIDILAKLELVPFTAERSALTGMPPDRVGSSIAAFDFLYLSQLCAHGVVAPTVGTEQRAANGSGGRPEPMHGGHILKPRPGLHEDVLVFDFKSLYPSIIRTFQIDPLGLIRVHRAAHQAAGDEVIEAPNGARFRRQRGILTELLDDLFASRENAKAAGNTIASNAIKVLMNSFYGVLGTSACRFSHPLLANAITSFGKHFLLWAKGWMEQRGLTVLYGDTDSVFVAGSGGSGGPALAKRLNADLAQYVDATWRVRSYLEMEFETCYERLLLPSVRGGGRGATKRYVGLTGGELQFTGMEVVRRDWTALAHEVQRELYRRLFADEPVEEYLRSVIKEVTAGRRDAQLIYHKSLRKEADDYRARAPHVVAARKLAASRPGEPLSLRGVIDYVITVEGPEPAAGRHHRIDYEHYIERQLRPVAEPVLAISRRDFGEVRRNERQLELF
jgi:DNA polymerase-2